MLKWNIWAWHAVVPLTPSLLQDFIGHLSNIFPSSFTEVLLYEVLHCLFILGKRSPFPAMGEVQLSPTEPLFFIQTRAISIPPHFQIPPCENLTPVLEPHTFLLRSLCDFVYNGDRKLTSSPSWVGSVHVTGNSIN